MNLLIQCGPIAVTLFLSVVVAGCATPPNKEELAALDYGACPQNYEAKIKERFQSGVLVAYSGEPIIWPPQRYWYKAPPIEGSKLYAGYLVVVMVDQKRGSPQLQGKQLYGFLFKDDELVKKLDPMQMYSLGTQEAVGPIPKDERDWKVGHSAHNKNQLIEEWVLPGETVQNWSELISLQIYRNVSLEVTPEKVVAIAAQLHKKTCSDVSQKAHSSSPTELLYEQTTRNCAPIRDEYSIRKTIRGPRTMTEVSYAKTTVMNDAEKKKWTEIVGRAKFLNECAL
jgi:hypothetical protein